MQSPDETLWEIGIDNAGALTSAVVLTGTPENIKIERDDLTEVGLSVDNAGVVSAGAVGAGDILRADIRFESPDTTIWDVEVDDFNAIYTTSTGLSQKNVIFTSTELTLSNHFQVQNDECDVLFSVQEFEEIDPVDLVTQREGAYLELPMVTLEELASIENPTASNTRVIIEAYVDTQAAFGSNRVRKAYYDHFDNEWHYSHDLSLVFP